MIQSLEWEDPREEEMATHSSILAWEIPWAEGAWWATVHEVTKELDTTEQLSDLAAAARSESLSWNPAWDGAHREPLVKVGSAPGVRQGRRNCPIKCCPVGPDAFPVWSEGLTVKGVGQGFTGFPSCLCDHLCLPLTAP